MLCQILAKLQPDWVTSYHEHDSLLEHIDGEELSEEERKTAWTSYSQQIENNKRQEHSIPEEIAHTSY